MTGSFARAFLGLVATGALASACSSPGAVAPLDPVDAEADVTTSDATDASDRPDTGSDDASTDADTADADTADAADATDAAPIDSGPKDSGGLDVGPEDGGVLACGAETCGTMFQFCRIATSPGICPGPDAGVCPAGCPGCPPLARSCELLPDKCWSKPSCACILVEICGSVPAGTCEEQDGGFIVGCHGA